MLASLAKAEEPSLTLPFLLQWKEEQPVLYYNQQLLQLTSRWPDWLADWLEETLLHLLLGHHALCAALPGGVAAAIAADLEVWQFHSRRQEQAELERLHHRLHLPAEFDFQLAYRQVMQARQTVGRGELLPGQTSSPLSRKAHRYWHDQTASLTAYDLWRTELRPIFPSVESADTPWAWLINRLSDTRRKWNLPWPVLLRRFALTAQRDQSYSSLHRPSKRYQSFPGTRRRRRASLAVILDTSGSVSTRLRAQFFQELQQLLPHIHTIDLIEADYQVRNFYPFTGKVPVISWGGGGTDFNPALEHVNQQPHYDGVIYFTDGEATVPTVRCRFPLLWLIAHEQETELSLEQFPGQVIRMGD